MVINTPPKKLTLQILATDKFIDIEQEIHHS